tara:strand:- start:50 stop:310 length:261 start_codon:yes stop_codon:yes gene_type:complete
MNPYLENLIASGIAVTAILFAIAIIHTVYYYVTRNNAGTDESSDDVDLAIPAILRQQLNGKIPGNSHQRRIARRKAEKIKEQIFSA